jgi:hypothetical protein
MLKFFDADPGSGIRKFRSGMRDGKFWIRDPEKNIPDPQH